MDQKDLVHDKDYPDWIHRKPKVKITVGKLWVTITMMDIEYEHSVFKRIRVYTPSKSHIDALIEDMHEELVAYKKAEFDKYREEK
jgi:hypothetical protein